MINFSFKSCNAQTRTKFLEVEIFLQHRETVEVKDTWNSMNFTIVSVIGSLSMFCIILNQFETIVLHPYFVFFVICNENTWYDSQIIVSTCLSILRFLSYIFIPK